MIIIFFIASFQVYAQKRDLEVWNKNQVQVKPFDKIVIDAAEKIHYSTASNSIGVKYAEINVGHIPNRWLKYGLGYRLLDYNRGNGSWLTENRPMLFANLHHNLQNFVFNFANRIEYRTFKKADNNFRHRQAFSLYFPSMAKWGMTFYLSEETFMKLSPNDLHLARIYSGLRAIKSRRFDLDFYYALQKSRTTDVWNSLDILGLDFHFRI
ncbi:DUF2490 domain-containing protein [Maribellus sp. YY47]|uniref:DUF2490 domain-containing protein n=1 Tax=Maribellus sp. YY47 TaxID=2929486 RepID=UPI002001432F|nr:DUF2490 domain-containing protein [Maribellus sp. YY47]MCK3684893.1 DUF2490 domain-containing protein [Maribellus sp. YY47]